MYVLSMLYHTHMCCLCRRRTRPKSDVEEDRVKLVGKRVGMMGSVWPGEDPNVKFYGVVTKQMKFKGRKGELINGYEVLWNDGERERWPYSFLFDALVSDEDPLIRSDE